MREGKIVDMKSSRINVRSSIMADYRGVIFDIDGVLTFQGRVYPGAVQVVDTLQRKGIILRFLTNSTLKSRASAAHKLRMEGFRVEHEQVITASYATAVYLHDLNPRSVWVMVDRDGIHEFADFTHDTENPEYIVMGDNRSHFDFEHMNRALRLLLGGAKLIAMQNEMLDTSLGDVELNVGAWVGLLERATGVRAVSIGKPNPFVFKLALRSMGLKKPKVLVVGDRLETDVRGARKYGLACALVKTGEFTPADLENPLQPNYVFESIEDLLNLFE
jgi:HAD superfamily hydrolase (TIGR01458 family)